MQGLQPFYRYFEFNGRSGRAEYWQWIAIITVAGWLTGILDALNSTSYDASHRFTTVLSMATLIPSIGVGIRRFHDRGMSGWFYGAFCILFGAAFGMLLVGDAVNRRTGNDTYIGVGAVLGMIWLVYGVYCIIQLAKPGDLNTNAYGEPPTARLDVAADLAAKARAIQGTFTAPNSSMPKPADTDPLLLIERLAKLRDAGSLTEEEFQAQKAVYLSRLS